jgi:hypothetical protein
VAEHYGLAHSPCGTVMVFASLIEARDDGSLRLRVVNGGYDMTLRGSSVLIEGMTGHDIQGFIVWKGVCPHGDYNTAIPWIAQEVAAGRTGL